MCDFFFDSSYTNQCSNFYAKKKGVCSRLYRENEGLIYKVTKVYSYSKEDEQDLYQEIVYQLWKSFSSFRNESKISTWMYRIALNTSIAHLNKEKKRKYVPVDEGLYYIRRREQTPL